MSLSTENTILSHYCQVSKKKTNKQKNTTGGFDNILSWRFVHETFSTVILSLPLIQEGQLSVAGERLYIIRFTRLED